MRESKIWVGNFWEKLGERKLQTEYIILFIFNKTYAREKVKFLYPGSIRQN